MSVGATTGKSLRIGLRFDRRDVRRLHELAERAKQRDLQEAHNVFALAGEAATTGEPLIVICGNQLEAVLMAKAYVRWGVREPVLEQLSG
jgi:hypothetical protein